MNDFCRVIKRCQDHHFESFYELFLTMIFQLSAACLVGMYKKEGMSECKECGFGKEPNYLQTDCGLCFIP